MNHWNSQETVVLQMFFKLGRIKYSLISTENTCVGGLNALNFIKNRSQHRFFSCEHYEICKKSFFYRKPLVAVSDSPTTHSTVKISCGVSSLISRLLVLPSCSKTYTKRCTNNSFTITLQSNFFLAWIVWSCPANICWSWRRLEDMSWKRLGDIS